LRCRIPDEKPLCDFRHVEAELIMRMQDIITRKLTDAFAPQRLEVIDDSARHAGHAGHREGGETHFNVHIVSLAFKGKSRIERHRMIHAVLAEELAGTVHALAIDAKDE
jgi:BolA family transcriptional regulator, general stress-responsive regulator